MRGQNTFITTVGKLGSNSMSTSNKVISLLFLFSTVIGFNKLAYADMVYDCQISTQNIYYNWTNCKSILVSESIVIPEGETLNIAAGSNIYMAESVVVKIFGGIVKSGIGEVTFASAADATWDGLEIKTNLALTLDKFNISGASTGITLISSAGVDVTDSIFSGNGTGVRLTSDDGVRSRVNRISGSQFLDNGIGVSAISTGLDSELNLFNGNGYGILLSGETCGAGSACGWRSKIVSNLIANSSTAIWSYGHIVDILNNDIINAELALDINMLKEGTYHLIDINNIMGWKGVGVRNNSPNTVNVGNLRIDIQDDIYALCDLYDNYARGRIYHTFSDQEFPATHPYPRPQIEQSGTSNGESLCPSDGYKYIDTDQEWLDGVNITESMYIESGVTVSVAGGSGVFFDEGVGIAFAGALVVNGEENIQLTSKDLNSQWAGLIFQHADAQVLSKLNISGASTGITIVSSADVDITDSILFSNGTGVRLTSDDGVRSRVNRISGSQFLDNGTGISASSTGLDSELNLFNGNVNGISLSGSTCGGAGACGYYSSITSNQFYGSNVAMTLSAHSVDVLDNDLSCNVRAIELNQYGGSSVLFGNNNFGRVNDYSLRLFSSYAIDLGNVWTSNTQGFDEEIYDQADDINLGSVTFTIVGMPYETTGNSTDIDKDMLSTLDEYIKVTCPNIWDTDADQVSDFVDNCPNDPNYSQENYDGDAVGDACDDDDDNDGASDTDDNCILHSNPDQVDTDGDGYGNLCDGDLNNDGSTNTLDLNLYKQAHRKSVGDANYNTDADFNGDGMINTLDLNIYKGLHRKPPGPSCCAP